MTGHNLFFSAVPLFLDPGNILISRLIYLSAYGAGVLSHLGLFIRGEWHMLAPQLLALYVLIAALITGVELRNGEAAGIAFYHAISINSTFIFGVFSSMVLYRVSPFHRLHSFPGPRLAPVSKFWHVWQCRDSRNHELMARMFEEYGDFVRIGPSELAIFHPDAFKVLEGYGTRCLKSDFYDLLLPDFSLVFTRDKTTHDARRSVWSHALSTKSISLYQPRINRQIEVLKANIAESAAEKKPVAINEVMYWFTFDSMGEFAFNQDFGMMRRREWHFAIRLFRRALSIVGPFAPTMWLMRIGFAYLPWFWKIGDWFRMMRFCYKRMDQRMQMKPEEKDIATFFLDEAQKQKQNPYTENWLKGDTATVVVAGSDTTAPSLTFLFYCLAQHPEDAEKIYEELKDVDPLDLNIISSLPHLNGAINEAMRLYSVAPTIVSRLTPPEGVMIGDRFIPGDTKVIAPRWVIFRREDCFKHATKFIPERWYSKPELAQNKRVFAPFGMGRASCVGQGMAITQLRLVLATLIKDFHVRFLPGEDGHEVLRDMRDQLTAQPGKLSLIFEPRRKDQSK